MSGPPRLRVGIVGAGRVGAVLGHDIVAVSAVSDLSRLRAEALLPGVPIRPVPDVIADADLVLLSVPDDVLPGLVQGLADTGAFHVGQFVAHASGRHQRPRTVRVTRSQSRAANSGATRW